MSLNSMKQVVEVKTGGIENAKDLLEHLLETAREKILETIDSIPPEHHMLFAIDIDEQEGLMRVFRNKFTTTIPQKNPDNKDDMIFFNYHKNTLNVNPLATWREEAYAAIKKAHERAQ